MGTLVPAAGLPVTLSAMDERSFTQFLYRRSGGVVMSYFHPFRARISFFTSYYPRVAFYPVTKTFCTLMTGRDRLQGQIVVNE